MFPRKGTVSPYVCKQVKSRHVFFHWRIREQPILKLLWQAVPQLRHSRMLFPLIIQLWCMFSQARGAGVVGFFPSVASVNTSPFRLLTPQSQERTDTVVSLKRFKHVPSSGPSHLLLAPLELSPGHSHSLCPDVLRPLHYRGHPQQFYLNFLQT